MGVVTYFITMRPAIFACYLAWQAADLSASSFEFRDFASPRNLNTVGVAQVQDKALRLTEARLNIAGAAWYAEKEPVSGGFDTTFQFRLTGQGGLGNGADGFAFVVQNSDPSAVAGRGSAGGWGSGDGHKIRNSPGIPRALAVFFDTFKNEEDHDPSDNYIVICNNGGPRQMRWPPRRVAFTRQLPVFLKDGQVHTARILYKAPVISVFLDDMSAPVLISPVDMSLVTDPEGRAFVGFTASTGSGWENHDILSWSFSVTDVSSAMVSSNISFFMDSCLPGRSLCTPDRAIVEEKQAGLYHVVLPANLEWGAALPNPNGRAVNIDNVRGTVCWELKERGAAGCNGPDGNETSQTRKGYLDPAKPPGSLIMKTSRGQTLFSVNDHAGAFRDNEGYFEFDVEIK
jgi:hypothetical protein